MEPHEPESSAQSQQDTSLVLPDRPLAEVSPADSHELDLPASSRPLPPQPEPEPAPDATPSGPLGNLVVAHFRRVEIAMLGRVLITTLAGALPASMVQVEHRRSFGRKREPIGVTVTAGDRMLSFRAPEVGVAQAVIGHSVRGVVLSSSPVPLGQWLDELASVLDEVTRNDEAARVALERALLS